MAAIGVVGLGVCGYIVCNFFLMGLCVVILYGMHSMYVSCSGFV